MLKPLLFLAPDEKNLNNLLISIAELKAWQKIKDEKISLDLTASQEIQTDQKISQATDKINILLPETWQHLLAPFQEKPGFNELNIEENQLNSGIGSLAERAFQKCLQEELIYQELGARILRDKLNDFLWEDKNHIFVSELIDWCQKYLYLPRLSSNEVIINALQNARAALSGESTFYLADSYDEISQRYEGLRPQFKSTYPPTLKSLIVKTEIAEAQKEEVNDPIKPLLNDVVKENRPIDEENKGNISKIKPKNYQGSLKLDPTNASLSTSKFMNEVMSYLQALPDSEIEMTLDIHVKNENGIDKQTARIILENSIALDVDNPEIF